LFFPSASDRTIAGMDRDFLADCIDRGMSLPEIGALTNRHASTVGYWVKKHGLVANGSAKYASRGYWLARYGLRKNGTRGCRPTVPRRATDDAIAAGLRTITGRCRHHGEGEFVIENSGRARCRKCRIERVAQWRGG
jgi:hypothetical protein